MTDEPFTSGSKAEHAAGASRPDCPMCKRRMGIRVVAPALAGDYDDVFYACEACGVEVKRTVKRN